jgi:hypothetical protein
LTEQTVSRNHVAKLFIAMLVIYASVSASASDFWVAKDWHQWAKHECAALLAESPWTHTWRAGRQFTGNDSNPSTPMTMVEPEEQLKYVVQLRSSLPVRRALIRQQQLEQDYDNMSSDQRAAFDTKALQILERKYADSILVHVDFSGTGTIFQFMAQLRELARTPEGLRAFIITEDGLKLSSTRLDVSARDDSFDIVFPRAVNDGPVIRDGQKHFSVQFRNPSKQTVEVQFDLSRMLVNGKPSF